MVKIMFIYRNPCHIFFFVVLFFFSCFLHAKEKTLQASSYFSVQDGLSQTTVNCLFEDSEGYLWIGTRDGLNLYNGYNFEVFRVNPSLQNSISDNYIRAIEETDDGKIWIATNYHIAIYDKTKHVFHTVKVTRVRNDLPVVYSLFVDANQNVWAKTEKRLIRIDSETYEKRFFEHYNNPFTYVQNDMSFPLKEDSKGMLWLGTKDGLLYFDKELELFQRFGYSERTGEKLKNEFVTAIIEYEHEEKTNLLVGTIEGLYYFDRDNHYFERIECVGKAKDAHGYKQINDIFFDDETGVLVATNRGLFVLKEDMRLVPSRRFIHNNRFLDIVPVYSITKDKSNILWIGTKSGLLKFDLKPAKFNLVRNEENFGVNIPSNAISAIHVENINEVWMGSRDQGLFCVDVEHQKILSHYHRLGRKQFKLADDYVQSVFKDSRGFIWVGTTSGLGVIFSGENPQVEGACVMFSDLQCDIFRNNPVYDILEDHQGNIWFITNKGLHKFEYEEKKFISIYHLYHGDRSIPLNRLSAIEAEGDGKLWIASENELIQYNYMQGGVKIFQTDTLSDVSLGKILSLALQDSVLWVGTLHGLLRFCTNKEFFFNLENKNPPNVIFVLLKKIYMETSGWALQEELFSIFLLWICVKLITQKMAYKDLNFFTGVHRLIKKAIFFLVESMG